MKFADSQQYSINIDVRNDKRKLRYSYSYTFETDTSSLAVMQVKYLRTRDEIVMVSQN